MDPGRGQMLAVKRQPEGTGVRHSTTGKVCGKSLGRHRSKVSTLSDMQEVGLPLQPFSPPASFFGLCRQWEGCPPERVHPSLLQLPAGPHCSRHFKHTPVVATITLLDLSE